MTAIFASAKAHAIMYFSGEAGLTYVDYDARVAGRDIFSGSMLAQKYNLNYTLTNFVHREQPHYYDLRLGYEWADFSTKVTEPDQDTKISQTSSRFIYGGRVGYNPYNLPIKFSAYINSDIPTSYSSGLAQNSLIGDNLIYAISDTGKSVFSGVTFAFEPDKSRNNVFVRGLPRLYLDYRELEIKNSDVNARMDTRTRELAVAGLNKENNWLNYRSTIFENRLNQADGYTRQQIQIGHVNNLGQRLWSSLTNWIDVSVDGQLATYTSKTPGDNYEEYDLNFMAIAKRQTWDASTFMNYNRLFGQDDVKESIRIPVYVKGIYGADTNWYASANVERGRDKYWTGKATEESYVNSLSLGGTTFNRSSFVIAPSAIVQTTKGSGGADAYSVAANLESFSTGRFSNSVGLAGKVYWKHKDDGVETASRRSWSTGFEFTGTYRPDTKLSYKMRGLIEAGDGLGYLDSTGYASYVAAPASNPSPNYLRNYLTASAAWTPSADLTTSLEGSYDTNKVTDRPVYEAASLAYRLTYLKGKSSYRLDSRYETISDGRRREALRNQFDAQYLPDINHEATLRFVQQYDRIYAYNTNNTYEVLQKYSYKFFTRDGVVRNFATITQEYSYKSAGLVGVNAAGVTTQYLSFSGRYSPTAKISLTGSVKYEKTNPGMTTLYYGAGLNADFKLLVTTLDYSYAKRDADNRIEKRLAASVKRTF